MSSLITNPNLRNSFFTINKINNVVFSKLCIDKSDKLTFNSKDRTNTKFFSTHLKLISVNFKKFINNFTKVYILSNIHQYLFQYSYYSLNLFLIKYPNSITNYCILK